MKILYSFVVFFNFYLIGAWAQLCTLSVANDFGTNSLLLITNGRFVYPSGAVGRRLHFAINQVQEGYCPGSIVNVLGTSTGANSIRLTCVNDTRFRAPLVVHSFSNIRCDRDPVFSTRLTGNCPHGLVIEIGFQITPSQFVRTIDLCYNRNIGRTFWAHALVPDAIGTRQTIGAPPGFTTGSEGYFDEVPVASAYSREHQRTQVLNIFGRNRNLRNKYVSATGEHYFARGHLIPRTDMFYTAQQYSTFSYLNIQPIYQSINNGNWKLVEDIVRTFAANVGNNLDIWTGNLLNLALYYSPTENLDIYLVTNTVTGSPALIVPRLFFKLVYSRLTNQAIVFVTANNPFIDCANFPPDYFICREHVACRYRYPLFNEADRGITYCCTYNDFIQNAYASSIGLPRLPNNLTPFI